MARNRLESIVSRQRGYLFADVLMATLAGIIFVLQVSVLSGASDIITAARQSPSTPTVSVPDVVGAQSAATQPDQNHTVATMTRLGITPG